ncbi:MAG: sugar ABC transporter substrate-binding protein [Candidatus Pristimantibacillus lignocellulolyticus]|uniref:Sugar ABC transporter substrate-binding protein n=1 Tax=Candidatus Pristimantibacillus lignocellulolyticus TaxID=2994561 RepID=A0A9J6ZKC2_9BACL|nr:MAG: sugar ABC transporter substrate-binding protein [Candidatus Pristimantibacillus lignocellulolyticus]
MKLNSKGLILLVFTLVLSLVVAGCGSTNNTEGNSSDSSKKNVKLDFVWFSDGDEGKVMENIIADYEKENTNVDIQLIEVAYNDLSTKLKTMVSGGKPPALARISTTEIGSFSNFAVDLGEQLDGVDTFTSQFIDSIKPYYVIDNKVVASPMDVTANGIIYNKTLFDQAGVAVPTSSDDIWTWDEFNASLKEVMEKSDAKYGLVWDFTPHRWSTLLYQFGGSMINSEGTEGTINNEAGIEAVNYFKKMHDDGIIPKSIWLGGENPNNLFRTGTVAAHLSGNWMVSNYKDITDFEWGVTYMPIAKNRSSVPGGKFVMAFQKSGVEEEAANFIAYLSSKEVNSKFNQESLFMSPRKDSADLDYAFGKEMFAIFADELNNTIPAAAEDWSKQTIVPKFSSDLKDGLVEVLAEGATAEEMLNDINDRINEAIANAK